MTNDRWIWIPNWEKFQHYKDRNPPWIKNYTDLLHRDEYLNLSSHLRGVLHGIWLEYASTPPHHHVTTTSPSPHLSANTRSLSARLRLRVMTRDIEALNQAGFIELVASNVLAERLQAASTMLASRAPAHSQEAETETKKIQPPPTGLTEERPPQKNGSAGRPELEQIIEELDAEPFEPPIPLVKDMP